MENLSALSPSSVKYCYFGWKTDSSFHLGITCTKVPQKALNLGPDVDHQRKNMIRKNVFNMTD